MWDVSKFKKFKLVYTATISMGLNPLQRGKFICVCVCVHPQWCPRSNILPSKKMDTVTRVQILDETFCILRNINTIGKGVNPTILFPTMNKL